MTEELKLNTLEIEIYEIIREEYDLTKKDSKTIAKKVINFIENKCLEWNHISCEWEVR